jgi:hypothetical protein
MWTSAEMGEFQTTEAYTNWALANVKYDINKQSRKQKKDDSAYTTEQINGLENMLLKC